MFGVKQLKEINMMKCKHFPEKNNHSVLKV